MIVKLNAASTKQPIRNAKTVRMLVPSAEASVKKSPRSSCVKHAGSLAADTNDARAFGCEPILRFPKLDNRILPSGERKSRNVGAASEAPYRQGLECVFVGLTVTEFVDPKLPLDTDIENVGLFPNCMPDIPPQLRLSQYPIID